MSKTFKEIYEALPERTAPKSEFVKRIADVTKRSELTVRCWLSGRQVPDRLAQETIAEELGVPVDGLFINPKNQEEAI